MGKKMMDEKEMLTVEAIDKDWEAFKSWDMDSQSLMRMAKIFDLARRAVTEIPRLEGDCKMYREQAAKNHNAHVGAAQQVERMREALVAAEKLLDSVEDDGRETHGDILPWRKLSAAEKIVEALASTDTDTSVVEKIRDEALEDAASLCDLHGAEQVADIIRSLKGTSNG